MFLINKFIFQKIVLCKSAVGEQTFELGGAAEALSRECDEVLCAKAGDDKQADGGQDGIKKHQLACLLLEVVDTVRRSLDHKFVDFAEWDFLRGLELNLAHHLVRRRHLFDDEET